MSITLWNTFLKRVVRGLTALRMSNPTLQILPTAGYLWNIYLPQYRREHCLCKNKQNRFFPYRYRQLWREEAVQVNSHIGPE